ncbi:MAG: hypothetical protein CFK48_12125, partial [Armatimonadetes bacterium CP1_7O]
MEFSANKLRALLEQFGDPDGVFSASASALREVSGIREADVAAIENASRAPVSMPALLESGEVQLLVAGVSNEYP